MITKAQLKSIGFKEDKVVPNQLKISLGEKTLIARKSKLFLLDKEAKYDYYYPQGYYEHLWLHQIVVSLSNIKLKQLKGIVSGEKTINETWRERIGLGQKTSWYSQTSK